jgi:hypothetical protein
MDDGHLGNVQSNATLLEGFSIKALEKYSLKLHHFRPSWIGGLKGVKKVKHARRMSKTHDDWKCKTHFLTFCPAKNQQGFRLSQASNGY